ncbi:hypothetical protein ABPG72_019070 [Tetrahymena utriculariae]
MQGKNNYRKNTAPQYPDDEKGAYYRSSDQNSDHPLSRINFCIDFIEKTCSKGDTCKKRHIYYAQLRKELKSIQPPYKKHLCQLYEQQKKCPKSKFLCLFAHGESDIWNSKFPETKSESINSTEVDERKRNQKKQEPIKQKSVPQQQNVQALLHENKQEDLIQQIIKMKKQQIQSNKIQPDDGKKKKENNEKKPKSDNKKDKQQNIIEPQIKAVTHSRNNNREKKNVQPQQNGLRVHNNQRNQEVSQSTIQKRNGKRTNQKSVNPDAMSDEQFDEYLLQLKEEMLMNEQGEEKDNYSDDNEDDEDQNEGSDEIDNNDEDIFDDEKEELKDCDYDSSNSSDDKDNDLFIDNKNNSKKQIQQQSPSPKDEKVDKQNKNQKKKSIKKEEEEEQEEEESWESDEDQDNEDEDNGKEIKDQDKIAQKSKNGKENLQAQQNLTDFKNIDWKNLDENKFTNQQLMTLYATILQNENEINSQDDEESDENNLSKEYNQLDEQKLEEERQKRKQERTEQRKKKKEEKKQQKQLEKDKKTAYTQKQQTQKNNSLPAQSVSNGTYPNNVIQNRDQFFQFDQLEIFCFCYFNTEADLKNWKEALLDVFYELQIPRNALIITEEDRCEGEFGVLIKLKSLRVVCLQLLRINLYKTQKLKILFKIIANPDSQISFSKQIIATKKLNEYSFQGQDSQTYIIFNSTIDHSESENLEFKNYDFRNYNENTRKLEEVITGMLNREEFENEQFYNKEQLSGRIFLGVKDATRQFVGSCITNNHHESFFTFLAKRLRDCQPAVRANLYQREECRLVIPGENENEFFPILDLKIFIISVNKPEKNTIYATSSGLYFQKIEEGNWPMSACSLYEKRQKNYMSEEKFKLALKQLDRRYFYVMAKMANQNALIQSDFSNIEQSQF